MPRCAPAHAVLVAVVLALASGCTLGPNYSRPALPMPSDWRDARPAPADSADLANLANLEWWELFRDPRLQELIRTALAENQDLAVAVERIVEARARVGIAQSELLPQVTIGADGGYLEQSREGFPNLPKPNDNDSGLYSIGTDLSWELDLFGRIRRSTEAERARLLATEETRRAVAISLVAAVARTYAEMRSADLRLEIARRTLETRAESLRITRVRFEGGLTSEKDPRQAEAEYHRIAVAVLRLEQLVRLRENQLSVLLGRGPGPIARGLSLPDLPVALVVPAGLPSELLERRPDLRAAEEQLHATTADVGAAKALLFPRIALTASFGTTSTELDALFTGSSQAWSVAAGVLQPVFQGGRNVRRLEAAKSRMRQSLYLYEKAVLEALREVEDSLVTWQKTGAQRGEQHSRVLAERRVVELTKIRYEGGVTDYLEVLDSQRSLFNAELDEVETLAEHVVSLVQLYAALGGGWPAQPEPAAASPAALDEPAGRGSDASGKEQPAAESIDAPISNGTASSTLPVRTAGAVQGGVP